MTREDASTLWIFVQPDGRWAGQYVDCYGALDIARDCASPEAVKAAVVDAKGVRPRIGLEPRASGVPRRQSGAQLTLAFERCMLAMANRHISAARTRIHPQEERLATLARDGHDTALGLQLLGVLRETLQTMMEHRQLIVEQIECLNRRDHAQAVDA